MTVSVQKYIRGSSAVEIAGSVERAIHTERLVPGAGLPTVRALAEALDQSQATVASAYRTLRARGLVVTQGRRGTRVSERPPLTARAPAAVPDGVRDLADGNPDPDLLPDLLPALGSIDPGKHLYGRGVSHPPLLRASARRFEADGISAAHQIVVSGALDGLERALDAHLRPGDRVAVEDPAFLGVLDLLQALGLVPVPVAMDEFGPLPQALTAALERDVAALIVTPRAQNPTGAALDARRVRALRRVLRRHPDLLILEDDHAGPVAGVDAQTLCAGRRRWAVVRSVSKSLGPDLRVAMVAGDATTIARIEGGTIVGMRWVSHVLQRLVLSLWSRRGMSAGFRKAANTYGRRRKALLDALALHGIAARGRSGLNVWVPVREEAQTVSRLLESGWAVTPGERFGIESGPAIRVCIARLSPSDAIEVAASIASAARMSAAAAV
jgi:DNA-binding transcriptional MocR family regulator